MPFISKNGTQILNVPSGQKILITSYGAGQSFVSYGTQPSGFPQSFRQVAVIENSSFTSATFVTQSDVLIEAGECEIEYVIAVTPIATRERYQPGSVAITGGTASFGTLACTGVTTVNAIAATGTGLINLSPTGAGTITLSPATAGSINNMSIGATTQSSGSFTTLAASGVVSGVGFSNYFASPPAIGSTAQSSGSFTTLAASGAVSGVGFTNLFASPPAIGGTVQSAGSFTSLTATGALTANGANVNHSLAPTGTGNVTIGATGTGVTSLTRLDSCTVTSTDSSATPGNATINTLSGRAAFAAAGTTVVITNSKVTVNSKVFVQQRTDATLKSVAVVPAVGSFTVTANAAATATTIFDFFVIN
jgi:hypothetical protein